MADEATEAGGETPDIATGAKEKLRETAGQAREQAGRVVDQIREHAESFANEKKAAAAAQIGGLASALRKTAEELDRSEIPLGNYVERAAESLEDFSESIKERDFGDLLADLEGMARQYPAMFLGSAIIVGFMLVRFLKTSPPRPARRRNAGQGAAGASARTNGEDREQRA